MSDPEPAGAEAVGPVIDALVTKATVGWGQMFVLAMLAGAFIGFGSIGFVVAQAVPGGADGPAHILSGLVFATGLILVMVAGAELFTGNTMMALPTAIGRLTGGRLAGSWALVWLGNLVGGVGIALLFVAAGGLEGVDGAVGDAAADVVSTKLAKGAGATFASGILANMLVCLAVWMSAAAPTIPGKILAALAPITVFVAAGLEHSIANMSILPIGFAAASGPIDWPAVVGNLGWSTLGNVVGGCAVAFGLARGHGLPEEGS